MQFYNQLDPKYNGIMLGNTKYSINRWGCTTCSICMILSKYDSLITPDFAAKKWKYTDDGLIIWNQLFSNKVKFVQRLFGYDETFLKGWIKDKNNTAIIEVNGCHWLAVDRYSIIGLNAIDPLGGKPIRVFSKYKKITKMVLFTKQ